MTSLLVSLNSTPNTEFKIDFYANRECNPSGYGEGERYLRFTTATTDPGGNASPFASRKPLLSAGDHGRMCRMLGSASQIKMEFSKSNFQSTERLGFIASSL